MSKKLFAVENDGTDEIVVAADAPTVEEAQVAEVVEAQAADVADVDAQAAMVEEGVTASDDMAGVEELVEAAVQSEEGLPAVAAESIRLHISTICSRLGADPRAVYSLYATENFASASSRKANTAFALEGVKEFLMDLWKKLKAALTKLWAKVKAFWDKHISSLGRVKKALVSAKAKVKASSGNLKAGAYLEEAPSSLLRAFATNGDLNFSVVGEYIANQADLHDMAGAVNDSIGAMDVAALKVTTFNAAVEKISVKDLAVVGGENLTVGINVDTETKKVSVEVSTEPHANVDNKAGMTIADKSEMTRLLDATIQVIDYATIAKKDAEKVEKAAQTKLGELEAAIKAANLTADEQKVVRTNMSTLYKLVGLNARVGGIVATQNVRLAKGVLSFVGTCLKQYK